MCGFVTVAHIVKLQTVKQALAGIHPPGRCLFQQPAPTPTGLLLVEEILR